MAASGLSSNPLVGIGLAISLLLCKNGLRKQPCRVFIPGSEALFLVLVDVVVLHCEFSLTGFSSASLMKNRHFECFLINFHCYKIQKFHSRLYKFTRIHTVLVTTISMHDSCMVIISYIIKSTVYTYYTGYATSTTSHALTPMNLSLLVPPITTSVSPGRVATKQLDRAVGMCPMICQESIDGS